MDKRIPQAQKPPPWTAWCHEREHTSPLAHNRYRKSSCLRKEALHPYPPLPRPISRPCPLLWGKSKAQLPLILQADHLPLGFEPFLPMYRKTSPPRTRV